MLCPPETLAELRAGDAVAVLVRCGDVQADERDHIAAAALRILTGRGDIAIGRRPSGRPRLDPPYPELGVSMSRRGDLLLVGFSPTRAVGVDIEADSPGLDPGTLAADHFSTAEAAAIAALRPEAARDAFLRAWVAKEAALKLTGRGIYDGVREPELAHVLDRLCVEQDVVLLCATPRLPPMQVVVRRHEQEGVPVHCALAVQV